MKKILFSLVVLMGLTAISPVWAQERNDGKRGGRRDIPQEMKLTDKQREEMRKISADFREKMDKAREANGTRAERDKKVTKLREEKREAMKKVLTKEQQEFFGDRMSDKNWRDRDGKSRRGDRFHRSDRGPRKGNGDSCCSDARGKRDGRAYGRAYNEGCCFFESDLDLTKEQKEKMEKLHKQHMKDRDDTRKKHWEEMKKILTPEQLKKLEEKKK